MRNLFKSKDRIIELREERELFSRFALVAQSQRGLDMKEVIGHYELSLVPRSLKKMDGTLKPGHEGKSKLMNAIIKCLETPNTEDAEDVLEEQQN